MSFDPSQTFQNAVSEFKNGQLNKASELCLQVIQNTAPNPVSYHLMGVIEHHKGHSLQAEQWIRKALELNSKTAEVHFNLGLSLLSQNKFGEALSSFNTALELKPHYSQCYYQIANCYKELHQHNSAKEYYEKSLTFDFNNPETHNSLGVVLCQLNCHEIALQSFTQALKLRPHFPEALNNMGVAYLELDRPDRSKQLCAQALELRPNYTAALNNLGTALKNEGSFDEAIHYYEKALEIDPKLLEARNNLGLSMMYGRSSIESAVDCFLEVLKQHPNHAQALNNFGITLCYKGHFEEGIQYYRKALMVKQDYTEALNNLACALRATGKIDEAIALAEQVISQKHNYPEAHNNYAMLLMSVGRFEEGLHEYQWRWKTHLLKDAYQEFSKPLWKGQSIAGKTLLVHAEQGLGDSLQFCRYISECKKLDIKVIFQVPQQLGRIVKTLKSDFTVITPGDPIPPYDWHCPLLDLLQIFKVNLDNILADIPYLHAYEDDIEIWKQRIGSKENKVRVGLVWSGNPRQHSFELSSIDKQRSVPIEFFKPLMHLPKIEFYSLQKNGPSIPAEFPILDFMYECKDFADTAALMSQLDLIISVDTSVAHLAGALGKNIWLLNRFDSCWRWFYNRDDSPWYPHLRQFRQKEFGNWEEVIDRVRHALINYKFNNI